MVNILSMKMQYDWWVDFDSDDGTYFNGKGFCCINLTMKNKFEIRIPEFYTITQNSRISIWD